MTKTIKIQAHQLCADQFNSRMQWNCDEYIISYNRKTSVLTVENFEGFDDDGVEVTEVLTEAAALSVLNQYEPGWIGLDGFVKLKDHYGDRWTIGTTPI